MLTRPLYTLTILLEELHLTYQQMLSPASTACEAQLNIRTLSSRTNIAWRWVIAGPTSHTLTLHWIKVSQMTYYQDALTRPSLIGCHGSGWSTNTLGDVSRLAIEFTLTSWLTQHLTVTEKMFTKASRNGVLWIFRGCRWKYIMGHHTDRNS